MAPAAKPTHGSTIAHGTRSFNTNQGGKLAVIDMGTVTAANVIVAGAITLDGTDLRRMGFSKLLAAPDASAWTAANAFVPCSARWDAKNGKLMLYDAAGAALTAAAIGNGGTLRLLVLGM